MGVLRAQSSAIYCEEGHANENIFTNKRTRVGTWNFRIPSKLIFNFDAIYDQNFFLQ